MWDFTSPRKVIFGEDALEFLSEQEFRHVFIVTDPTMKKLHLNTITKHLEETELTIFDEVTGEPTLQMVQKGAKAMIEVKPDVIIALGGGSVLDAAKGMFPIYSEPDLEIDTLSPFDILDIRKRTGCMLINIPTTSGTGADVTWAVVLTDTSGEVPRKISLANRELVADITILDPILTKTMPPKLIAGTGFDAISHTIDGYLSTWRNDFSDALLRHAFKLMWENLPLAVEQAKKGDVEPEIGEKIHNAATMAGWGFGNSQIILSHALGHSVGAVFHIPHSVCIGAMCWYCLMFNKDTESERIAELGRLAGFDGSDDEVVSKFITGYKNLLLKLEMPISLKDMGVERKAFEDKVESVITYAENDSGTLSNPRPLDHKDFVRILECVYDGKEIDF
ncbi:MAG: iron-containing alcohol dehydrogenase [Candidatus Hodarchaeales archaeon]